MNVIDPYYEILTPISDYSYEELRRIERTARICYKSTRKDGDKPLESAKRMVKMLIDNGHEAMLEHSDLSVRFVVDRAIANELTRHRVAAYAQESTRYCNYANAKFNREITVIRPSFFSGERKDATYDIWLSAMFEAETNYFRLIDSGATPQEARLILPLSLKSELIVSANYREWRHILKLRTAKDAHPQMREVMVPLLRELQRKIAVVFDDILVEEEEK